MSVTSPGISVDGTDSIRLWVSRAEPVRWLVEKYQQYTEHQPAGPVIRIEVSTRRGWSAAGR